PGTDQLTAHALRRTLVGGEDRFPRDVLELQAFLAPEQAGQRIRAVPGAGSSVPLWILGSSTFGAQLAAMLGLPFGFASHFAPDSLMQALAIYRERFQPSAQLDKPYAMCGYTVVAAATDEEAQFHYTSAQIGFANQRRGMPGKLPAPRAGFDAELRPEERAQMEQMRYFSAVGSPETVKRKLDEFVALTQADELIITSHMYDHAARLRSYEIVADAWGLKP
ncbi:MAG: MsnO8 family LLM class oxidoreductase, partial [Hyphomonadaceae bacterium]